MVEKRKVSRRKFIKGGSVGAVAAALTTMTPAAPLGATGDPASKYNRALLISRLGDTLIPSGPDDPGYSTLEPYNITAEVMKGLASLSDEYLALFNTECAARFDGRTFLELPERERAEYLNRIADGVDIADRQVLERLQS
ncbi:MAG: twin-arginine translocation signal domain-containing protein, partial [Acidobacteria bacterium]|nr:twin-arginine translocation signal domain-containing protein [Acidobacteriota bacterium]